MLPPPVADPMHWFTVMPDVAVPSGTLFVTMTLQYTLLPPPVTMPLHWFTEVTSWFDEVLVVTGPEFRGQEGNTTPAAARHALVVTVELVAPVEEVLFTTVTVQVTWNPAVIGKSGGLHWLMAGAVSMAAGEAAPPLGVATANDANIERIASTPTRAKRPLRVNPDGARR